MKLSVKKHLIPEGALEALREEAENTDRKCSSWRTDVRLLLGHIEALGDQFQDGFDLGYQLGKFEAGGV